jgi:hypothetical protein
LEYTNQRTAKWPIYRWFSMIYLLKLLIFMDFLVRYINIQRVNEPCLHHPFLPHLRSAGRLPEDPFSSRISSVKHEWSCCKRSVRYTNG